MRSKKLACRKKMPLNIIIYSGMREVLACRSAFLPSLLMFLGSCWFFPSCEIMPSHAKSCPFRQNHAISDHGLAWIYPPTLVEFPKEERVQFYFVCVAPIPLISVLLLWCATVEFLKLCFSHHRVAMR